MIRVIIDVNKSKVLKNVIIKRGQVWRKIETSKAITSKEIDLTIKELKKAIDRLMEMRSLNEDEIDEIR